MPYANPHSVKAVECPMKGGKQTITADNLMSNEVRGPKPRRTDYSSQSKPSEPETTELLCQVIEPLKDASGGEHDKNSSQDNVEYNQAPEKSLAPRPQIGVSTPEVPWRVCQKTQKLWCPRNTGLRRHRWEIHVPN